MAVLIATPDRLDNAAFAPPPEDVIKSAAQLLAPSTKKTAACPGTSENDPAEALLIVHEDTKLTEVVAPPVGLTSLNVQVGTAKDVAVGRVSVTDPEKVYSMRTGLQSEARIVSVLALTCRVEIPGKALA